MSPDELTALATIAAERGGWPDDAADRVEEATIVQAREQTSASTDAHGALTELLSDVRQQTAASDGGQPCR